jgi:glycerol kinase
MSAGILPALRSADFQSAQKAMNQYIGAIDQGTTSTRFIIFDHNGNEVSRAQQEHSQILPKSGWVEHNPMEILDRTYEVIRMAISEKKIPPESIAAIGITNQRETTVVWNPKTGKPWIHAIVWQDMRTEKIVKDLKERGLAEILRAKTGLPISTYFSAPKLHWILKNIPDVADAVLRGEAIFGTIDTWLIWNLTGGAHITDPSNASRTMLMNLKTMNWDDELLEIFQIPREMLPQIRSSSDSSFYGYTQADGIFLKPVPICGNLGDQQAALIGQACFEPGEAKNTYGTGNFLLMNTGSKPKTSNCGLLTTCGYQFSDQIAFALEGSIAVTGSAVQWLRDQLKIIRTAAEVEALANSVSDNGGIFFVPAFSGLFAPYWRPDARGAIVGLSRFSNNGHLARATLESICYQTRDVLEAMREDSGVQLPELKVDGGATINETLMQLQADILGVPVIRPVVTETTALGAAYAAGLAIGFWKNTADLKHHWRADKTWEPSWTEDQRNSGYTQWKKAIERTLNWTM